MPQRGYWLPSCLDIEPVDDFAGSLWKLTTDDLHAATSQYYSVNSAQEDGRLKAHRIEFGVTLRTILNHLSEHPARVLDVGGGTGPYSFALAAKGHDVTLIDMSPGLISVARARLESTADHCHPTRIMEGNALALDALLPNEAGTLDAVLLLGPLYHIMSAALREDALRQAWAMVKASGVLICAWVSRWAHYRDVAMRDPGRLALKPDFYKRHAENGDYLKREGDTFLHAMNHEHPANMPAILRRVTGEHKIKMVGVEGVLAGGLDKLVNELEEEAFEVGHKDSTMFTFTDFDRVQSWVQKCLEVGYDDMGWMMSDHIIGIARKSAAL
ncbi:hypothetical protein NM688_g9358 [Phlebia brevispora]|uniref:Uncharacterized protein n=1 Tax=Phlebia brevispora TaxID=194682 RepID=A0ACC1RIG4_9APHY|nr:hypothetical protein NM688_g9358 [Phlebia brevispora]